MPVSCREVDISFLDIAPEKVINIVELEAPIETVFAMLEDENAWPKWFADILKVTWTSPKPFGVGTTRTVKLKPLTVWEKFFIWEDNKRFAFYFTQTSLPFVKALVEDYQLEKIDDNNTRFTYTVAYEPALPLKLTGPIGRSMLRRMFGKAAKSFVNYVAQQK